MFKISSVQIKTHVNTDTKYIICFENYKIPFSLKLHSTIYYKKKTYYDCNFKLKP